MHRYKACARVWKVETMSHRKSGSKKKVIMMTVVVKFEFRLRSLRVSTININIFVILILLLLLHVILLFVFCFCFSNLVAIKVISNYQNILQITKQTQYEFTKIGSSEISDSDLKSNVPINCTNSLILDTIYHSDFHK